MSPDGSRVAFTLQQADPEKNRNVVHVWLAHFDGGEPRRMTTAGDSNSAPAWSPDGARLVFVSNREDERPQLHVLPVDGGEAARITDLPHGDLMSPRWSPDGAEIAFLFRAADPEAVEERRATKKGDPWPKPTFRHVTRLHYKEDGQGFLPRDTFHVYVVPASGGPARKLTDGAFDHFQIAWSPDSSRIAFAANRDPDAEYLSDRIHVWSVGRDGKGLREVTGGPSPRVAPSWSPDGKRIAFLAHDGEPGRYLTEDFHVRVAPANGGPGEDLTPDLGRSAVVLTISDMNDFHDYALPPVWSADGKRLVFPVTSEGSVHLHQVDVATKKRTQLTHGEWDVSSFAASAGGDRLALVASDAVTPPEIRTLTLAGGKPKGDPKAITSLNGEWAAGRSLTAPEEFRLRAPEGHEIQGWTMRPAGLGKGAKAPLVVQVHGGPHAQYGWAFFHEMQLLVSRGWAVAYCNPRGSQGYGRDFADAITGIWGEKDFADVLLATEHAAGLPWVDGDRVAIMGGSYGGFMTNWALGHSRRFRCGITQRSVVNMTSMWGASDYGYDLGLEMGTTPYEDPDAYWSVSPLAAAAAIEDPLLILHSEEDHRCPVAEAEQLYTALKWRKKTVEMVRFRGESHGLSRGGRPQNRMERLRRILDWLERYL